MNLRTLIAYASVTFGVLTTQLSGVHLPTWGSVILGVFGILLHPGTSVVAHPADNPSPASSSSPPVL